MEPPNFDDITEFHIYDYKLVRTVRCVKPTVNQRIILHLKSEMYDHKELASFGSFSHQTEVSLYWCTIHQRAYCIHEYGSFKVPIICQDLSVLSEVIITCREYNRAYFYFITILTNTYLCSALYEKNIQKKKLCIEQDEQKNKLLAKRK